MHDLAEEIKAPERANNFWIKVYTDVIGHEVVGAHVRAPKPVDPKKQAWQPTVVWLWMLIEAAHKDRKRLVKGRMVHLERGQLVLTERFLADKANWTRKAAAVFLDRLAKFDMIRTTVTSREGQFLMDFSGSKRGPAKGPSVTIITICNYDRLQTALHRQGASQGAARGPTRGRLLRVKTEDTDDDSSNRSLQSQGSRERSKDALRTEEDRLPFTVDTIEELANLGLNVDGLIESYRKRIASGTPVRNPNAYLLKMGRDAYAKDHGITPAQAKGITSRNRQERVTAMANVVGAFARPSEDVLLRSQRRNGEALVNRAMSAMSGKSYRSQSEADRVFEGHIANLRLRK